MTEFNYEDGVTTANLLEENAKLNMALNYFFLRNPDKSSSWEYSRDQAEELAREVLEPTQELKGQDDE